MKPRIKVGKVHAEGTEHRQGHGAVFYEVDHGTDYPMHLVQYFSRKGETTMQCGALVWAATGPDDALTLTPSFLGRYTFGPQQEEHVVHLFLKDGKIELCGDSTVELA